MQVEEISMVHETPTGRHFGELELWDGAARGSSGRGPAVQSQAGTVVQELPKTARARCRCSQLSWNFASSSVLFWMCDLQAYKEDFAPSEQCSWFLRCL
jgi:hypothetical protein